MNRIEHERRLCKHYWCFGGACGGCTNTIVMQSLVKAVKQHIAYAPLRTASCMGNVNCPGYESWLGGLK